MINLYCIRGYFRRGFIFANFASQFLQKFLLQFMAIYSNKKHHKNHEIKPSRTSPPTVVQNCEKSVHEIYGVYSSLMPNIDQIFATVRPKKKKLLCCPLPTDRKMRKNRVVFFVLFFWKCQVWVKNLLKFVFNGLKKHLYILYAFLTAFRPSFPHLDIFKKILENSTLSRYVKKKNITKIDRPTQFSNFGRVRATFIKKKKFGLIKNVEMKRESDFEVEFEIMQ